MKSAITNSISCFNDIIIVYIVFYFNDVDDDNDNNNSRYTTNIPTDPCSVTTADIKANMRDIHTTIVSQHLAARDNNKILRTHPPQVSSTEENLPRHSRRTLVPSPTKNK